MVGGFFKFVDCVDICCIFLFLFRVNRGGIIEFCYRSGRYFGFVLVSLEEGEFSAVGSYG